MFFWYLALFAIEYVLLQFSNDNDDDDDDDDDSDDSDSDDDVFVMIQLNNVLLFA